MTPCRVALSLLLCFLPGLCLLPGSLAALDLRLGLPALQELTWTREGEPVVGPGPQVLRITPAGSRTSEWPAKLAAAEKARRRKKNRRAHVWRGFMGTAPTWGVDGEVLQGPPEAARIERRLEFWALAPGPFLVHLQAASPGGLGRRRAEKRFLFALRQLARLHRGEIRDPFREIRLSPEGSRWSERYRLRLPGGLEIGLLGPVPDPLPPLPLAATTQLLWQSYPFHPSLPEAPERFYQGTVPGYLLRFSPGFPSSREEKFLFNFLGVNSGVGIGEATPDQVSPEATPSGSEEEEIEWDEDF